MITYYTVYETTNIINDKIYVGVHRTSKPNDAYLGSGAVFVKALSSYGRKSFKKKILFIFNNEDDMYTKEAEIVSQEFVLREDTYNVSVGGRKSFSINGNGGSNLGKKYNMTEKGLEGFRQAGIKRRGLSNNLQNLSEEAKAKRRGPRPAFKVPKSPGHIAAMRKSWREDPSRRVALEINLAMLSTRRSRQQVSELRLLSASLNIKLPKGWPIKSDQWINTKLNDLQVIFGQQHTEH
jgi:hypothetical protein